MDHFTTLPPELLLRIDSLLGSQDLLRMRFVCQAWRHLILSGPLLDSLMRNWDPDRTLSIALSDDMGHLAKAQAMLAHMSAFRSGRAFDLSTRDIRMKGGAHPDQLVVAYGGGYFAWVNRNIYRAVQVLQLETQVQKKLEIPYKCALKITHLAISARYLCTVDNQSDCRIMLHGSGKWLPAFNLGSFDWLTLAAGKDTLALFTGNANGEPNSMLTIWKASTKVHQTIPFDRPSTMQKPTPRLALEVRISADENFAVAFYITINHINVFRLSLTNFTHTSRLIDFHLEKDIMASPCSTDSQDPRPFRELRSRSDREYFPPIVSTYSLPCANMALSRSVLFADDKDWLDVRAYIALKSSEPTPILERLQYSATRDLLRLSQTPLINVDCDPDGDKITYFDSESQMDIAIDHELNNLFTCRGVAYFWLHTPFGLRLHLLSLETGTIQPAAMGGLQIQNCIALNPKARLTMQKECFNSSRNRQSGLGAGVRKAWVRTWWNDLYGDERFLININLESLYVWSFDLYRGLGSFCYDIKGAKIPNQYPKMMPKISTAGSQQR